MNSRWGLILGLGLFLSGGGCGTSAVAQVTGGEFNATGSDVVPRYFHAAGMLQHNLVMVTGGLNLIFIPPSLESRDDISFYDPMMGSFSAQYEPLNGNPTTSPTLITPRSSHTQTTLLDGRVLITGGHQDASGTSPGTAFAGVELFDPITGIVSAGPSMADARAMHTATLLSDGRVVVAGGGTWQMFDPLIEQWSSNLALAHSRVAHAAVLLASFGGIAGDDRVLLIGGAGSGPATLELLDPGNSTTTLLTATLSVGVDDLAAVELADGRVFIAGGQNVATGDSVPNVYLYDPVADSIAAAPDTPNRAGGIADHEIARFGDYVAIFGGEQQTSGTDTVLDYVAIFDATTDQWFDDGTMNNLHDDFATVRLAHCGLLLVDGGVPFFGQEIPSSTVETFWLTDPALCLVGDLDNDGDVDTDDYSAFAPCLTGPTVDYQSAACVDADFDTDKDVDLRDFATFVEVSTP